MSMSKFYWHIHPNVLIWLLPYSAESVKAGIRNHEPEPEARLWIGLIKPVRGPLPPEVLEAARIVDETREALLKAMGPNNVAARAEPELRASVKAWNAHMRSLAHHEAEIEALHKVECPNCPWDGKTIFSKREG